MVFSDDLLAAIARVPDFPKPGILFYDILEVLETRPDLFAATIDHLRMAAEELKPTKIVSMEARGFLFGAPLAVQMGLPFVAARKPGKLPRAASTITYDLEYGSDTLAIHRGALQPGDRVLVVDDLLATGGTAAAAARLAEAEGAVVCGALFVIEIVDLQGSKKLPCATISLAKV